MAAVILKKKCLDIKRNLESISLVKMMHIIDSIKACISPGSTDFLKLCCDILVKLYIHMVCVSNNKEHATGVATIYENNDKL
jgi:hypothetical protein